MSGAIQALNIPTVQGGGSSGPITAAQKSGFDQLFERLSQSKELSSVFGSKGHEEILQFQNRALQGEGLSPRELLLYQVKAGEFNMRVELVSKAAESLLGTVKKLQNQP